MAPSHSVAGFFMLRTPALPWNAVEEWSQNLSAARTLEEGGDVESAVRRDVALLRERLRTLVKRPEIRAALYIASPHLSARLDPWLDGDDSEEACRVEPAVVRYFVRMAGRATPFGLFAGTSVGGVGPRLSLGVPPAAAHVRHTRLDAEYVFNLAERVSEMPALRNAVRFQPTAAAYDVAGCLRYYEPYRSRQDRRFRLVDVEPSAYLRVALDRAREGGGATMREIAVSICSSFGDVALADAVTYVEALIDAKLLWDTSPPAVTSVDPALDLVETLSASAAGAPLAVAVRAVLSDIEATNALQPHEQLPRYERIVSRLSSLCTEVDSARVLRVDLWKPGAATTISHAVVNDVRRHLELLARISSPPRSAAMRTFVREFERRYHGSEVPLLQALDEESGIGFDADGGSTADASSLLDEIPFRPLSDRTVDWSRRTSWLFERLTDVLHLRAKELVVSSADVEALSTEPSAQLPAGFSVLATIAAASADAANRGDYRIHLRKAFGPSSAKLLGRFCGGDSELHAQVRAALKREEAADPDAIHAEVVHLPHPHAANTICRPVLRDYEIPLFSRSGAPEDRHIALSDLFVSVDCGMVVLRSARHQRRVVPHLTCAHAFRKSSVGLYRFLAGLEEQSSWSELAFTWGPFASAPYLPRVVHDRCVLALEQWTIPGEVLRGVHALPAPLAFRALQDLRARLELPRFVVAADGDNALPVDFENVLSLQSWVKAAKQAPNAVLSELFPEPNELVAGGPEGGFYHELVIPFVREHTIGGAPCNSGLHVVSTYDSRRRNYPGSRWLYVKAYCGVATADRVLASLIAPFVAAARAERAIDRWFFVRHADPRWHVRVRLRGDASRLWKEVAPRLLTRLAEAGDLIQSVAVDTYDREEERYGGDEALDIAEQIFEADSDAALAIIERYGRNVEARWRLVLCGMDALLDDFGFTLEQKKETVCACRSSLLSRFRSDQLFRQRLGERYRSLRPAIGALLGTSSRASMAGADAIRARSQAVLRPLARLRELEDAGCLGLPRVVIAESYLHMWANRLFRSATNAQELVLYDFLHRFYAGCIGRERGGR